MKKLKHLSSDLRSAVQSNYQRAVVGSGLLMVGTAASATEPATGAAAAWAQLETMVTDMIGNVWPIVILFTLGFIGIKLFKKGANKAT